MPYIRMDKETREELIEELLTQSNAEEDVGRAKIFMSSAASLEDAGAIIELLTEIRDAIKFNSQYKEAH